MSVDIVVGLGFGDETKGATVDKLCSEKKVDAVVRFSGGPQTAHNVILPTGEHHTFAQFGSGTLRHVPTVHTRHSLINPLNLIREEENLRKLLGYSPLYDLVVSENSLLITLLHRSANQKREEQRGNGAHGSCGQGIGEAMMYATQFPDAAPRMGDMKNPVQLLRKLVAYRSWVEDQLGEPLSLSESTQTVAAQLEELFVSRPLNIVSDDFISTFISKANNLVFEGTQGVLLDEWVGFHPHTTWSTVTPQNALRALQEAGRSDAPRVLGIVRSYATRHGYGPFPTELVSESDTARFSEHHNKHGRWQGAWRVGDFDMSLMRYAVSAAQKVDGIVLSHCDTPAADVVDYGDVAVAPIPILPIEEEQLAKQYVNTQRLLSVDTMVAQRTSIESTEQLTSMIESETDVPVVMASYGPTSDDRNWL